MTDSKRKSHLLFGVRRIGSRRSEPPQFEWTPEIAGRRVLLGGCRHARTRRSFTPEFKAEAARRVIDGGRLVTEVARELNVHENLLGKWVRAERMHDGVADEVRNAPPDRNLSAGERAELTRLRAELAEKNRDLAFLKRYWHVPRDPVRLMCTRVVDHGFLELGAQ